MLYRIPFRSSFKLVLVKSVNIDKVDLNQDILISVVEIPIYYEFIKTCTTG